MGGAGRFNSAVSYRCRFQVRPLGAFEHVDVKPALVQTSVGPVELAAPLTVALPVHRRPPALSDGAEIVKVPEKLVFVTVPVTVPFQSKDDDTHVPVTLPSVWLRVTEMGAAAQFADCRCPDQVPPIWA
jgi:hypothetical protein